MPVRSELVDNYIKLSREMLVYYKRNILPPKPLRNKYDNALRDLKYELDRKGYRMPKPKYYYNIMMTNTHKYLCINKLNPAFKPVMY